MTYEEYIDRHGFRHFRGRELSRLAEREKRGVRNELPRRRLWPNVIPSLEIADRARALLGSPIAITSAFRSSDYNQVVGGVPSSQHIRNNALDLVPIGKTPRELYNLLTDMRTRGEFVGGLGLYRSFVHLDTRGRNATWNNA